MTSPPDASALIAAARHAVQMREAVDLIVQHGVLQRVRATEACVSNPYQPNLVWAPSIFGSPMELDLREEVCASIYNYGVFDAPLLAFLARTLKEGDIFFDVGAHIGFFTVAASLLVGDKGQVHAFEPMPETFNRLTVNARNTGRTNIQLVRAAAWNEAATLQFRDFGASASAFNSIFESRRHSGGSSDGESTIEAVGIRLDGYARDKGVVPTIIKIDVESAESQVIQGLSEILSSDAKPLLIVEVGDFDHLARAGVPSSRSIIDAVGGYGYSIFDLDADGGIHLHVPLDEPYPYMNLVCKPVDDQQ